MKTYSGTSDGQVFVLQEGEPPLALDPRYDIYNHSPDGFAWGYGGSGPSQLALALCADILGDDAIARRSYMDFKFAFVSLLPMGQEWSASESELRQFLKLN
jgi:hypothetical protein